MGRKCNSPIYPIGKRHLRSTSRKPTGSIARSSRLAAALAILCATVACDSQRGFGENRTLLSTECPAGIAQIASGVTKAGYVEDLQTATLTGTDFRRVVYTGRNLQLVTMTIQPGTHIGAETHADHDQFFRIEEGSGEAQINGQRTPISKKSGIIVPAGALHDIVNTGDKPMRLFTIYSPPEHQRNTVRRTKQESDAAAEYFDGCISE